jgi:hypothetical protein
MADSEDKAVAALKKVQIFEAVSAVNDLYLMSLKYHKLRSTRACMPYNHCICMLAVSLQKI